MERSIRNVCKDCEKRHLACHDSCEDYQSALKEWRGEQDEIRKARNKSADWWGFHRTNIERTNKYFK